jgi:uncharacterized membrane protein required for colicin V production
MPAALDAIVVGLALLLAVRGAFKGFVWQAIRTGAVVGGFFVAGRLGEPAGRLLVAHVGVPAGSADVAGWALVWMLCFVAGTLAAHAARKAVRAGRLAPTLDGVLGFALGALLGLGIAAFGMVLWASTQDPQDLRDAVGQSKTVEWMALLVRSAKPAFPAAVRARWGSVIDSLEPVGG